MEIKPIVVVNLPRPLWEDYDIREKVIKAYQKTHELTLDYFVLFNCLTGDETEIEHQILNPIHQINLPKPILKIKYNVSLAQLEVLKKGFEEADYDGYIKMFVPDINTLGWDVEILSPTSITINNSDQFIQNKNNQ